MLQPESKIAFARASEELKHRSGMNAGEITPSDLRDVGLGLMFVSRMDEFLDSSAQTAVKLEVFSAYATAQNLAQQGSWARKNPSPARRGQLG